MKLKVFLHNILVLIFLSAVCTIMSTKVPEKFLNYKKWLFRERIWENHGAIYQRLFRVKLWKKFVPELNDFIKSVFPKKKIMEYSNEYLNRYLVESCRSELAHWSIVLCTLVFSFLDGNMTFIIALALNLPYIIIQRYNRPRVVSILEQIDNSPMRMNRVTT